MTIPKSRSDYEHSEDERLALLAMTVTATAKRRRKQARLVNGKKLKPLEAKSARIAKAKRK